VVVLVANQQVLEVLEELRQLHLIYQVKMVGTDIILVTLMGVLLQMAGMVVCMVFHQLVELEMRHEVLEVDVELQVHLLEELGLLVELLFGINVMMELLERF
jgi:hypothetical protein